MGRRLSLLFLMLLCSFTQTSCTHKTLHTTLPETRSPSSRGEALPVVEFQEMVLHPILKVKMRAGYSLETSELKACVLYLQGLGDSVLNHKPYFSYLNRAGYRIIYFDYMGQGGSEGYMNDTRVQVELDPHASKRRIERYERKDKHYETPEQGDFFWSRYQGVQNERGQDCSQSPKLVIGWSTGGLSAYRMAHEERAAAVILIAPGIHPRWMVGESSKRWDKMILLRDTITERTLTRNLFENQTNPHVDAVRPTSPAHVPQFAGNLLGIAYHSTKWQIEPSVPGLVFLSGDEDTYVKSEATRQTLLRNAPHFEVHSYAGALHELDNEIPDVTQDLYEKSVRFFDAFLARR